MLNCNSKESNCPCGNKTENNLMCNPCLESSFPAYLADENGKQMSVDELMKNSIIPVD